MYRFVLTLLIGLMLSLGGGVSAFAKGEVIWEGTQESKLFSLTGPKKIRITTEGVFINGRFKPAWQLSKDDACLYGLSNFPNEGYIGPSEAWKAVLIKFDFHSCHSIRMQARHSFKFSAGSQSESNYVQPVTRKEMKEAFDAAKSKNFAKAKAIWERGHQNGNDEATRNLGVMYANGDGVKKDLNKAFEYYSKASEAGNLQATFEVMHYLYNGKGTAKDIPEMARLIEDTYKRHPDDMKANEWMGFIYLYGHAVTKNEPRARDYLDKAKSLGSEYASKTLAELASNNKASATTTTSKLAQHKYASENPDDSSAMAKNKPDQMLCVLASRNGQWDETKGYRKYVQEAKRRGLTCGFGGAKPAQVATNSSTNAELIAAEARAAELEKRLALLEAEDELVQRQIASDNQAPTLTIIQSGANGREGYLTGSVADNVEIAEVHVDGAPVSVAANGSFEWSGFVPTTGKDIIVEAIDTAALSSRQVVRIERGQITQAIGPMFDDLNPMAGRRVLQNKNALALIVGISDYERTDAPAIYADKDAQYFHDYASLKLGIPDQNITTLVNDKAEQGDVYLAVVDWLRRSSKPGKSDVFIFFAGHGLASQDGEQMYLLPFDGRPRLLDKTAILRDELFSDIAAANPRSVTVFLDTCYSGTTRGPDMLIASRPIAIRAKDQAVPEGFTVMTAAAGDQTANPLEEAKHGMFSYFLMKGMEGEADANQDNQITTGELHAYVQQNVIQQSSGSQTPELQGDSDRVLVKFQ